MASVIISIHIWILGINIIIIVSTFTNIQIIVFTIVFLVILKQQFLSDWVVDVFSQERYFY